MAQETDEVLARRVQGKNEAAFGVLMQRYTPKLLRYGRRFLSSGAHIEDAVQDVFIQAYQNMQSYDVRRPFSPWLYRIAHNMFVNTIRKNSRSPFVTLDLDTLAAYTAYETDPAAEEEVRETKALIDRGLEALSPNYREVLVLRYLEQLDYQEIADVLHVPLGTVGIRLHRARAALKKYVTGE